ncbi:TIGR02300 family protein [Terrarubrum flagellatum]|uniref:TIGR02300 family protein n=1 Tax=Terrirubrum flagellatum TaxID=2895980 RepID=UPI0031452734
MANPELGTKRICPVTGRKFYDLNKDPVVSPYTGQSYPRSAFEPTAAASRAAAAKPEADEEEDETEAEANAPETVSLEEAASEEAAATTTGDDVEVEDDGEEDDTFLEEEEEGDDDVSDLIDGDIESDEEA